MTKAQIIEMVKKDCKRYGVRVTLARSKAVRVEEGLANGYFCSIERRIVVATKGGSFRLLSDLFHEWSHMRQWVEHCEDQKTKGARIWRAIDSAPPDTRRRTMREAQLELDAERRTVKLLRKYKVGTARNRREYIKAAALYVLSHHVMADTMTWFKDDITLNIEARKLSRLLPSSMAHDFSCPPKPELYKAIRAMLR